MTLQDACEAYLQELKNRNLVESTIANYRTLFRLWLAYARDRSLFELNDCDQTSIRKWHESWSVQPSTAKTRYDMLRAFFTYAEDMGWTDQSPMAKLKPPKVTQVPTMPLSHEEFQAMALAAENLPRDKALILLMRYSGLSIGDAVRCRKDILNGNTLILRRTKSGELVIVPLPELVIESLAVIGNDNGSNYYFWSGTTLPVSVAKYWRSRLHRISRQAGIEDFRPHRLRDTFAVEMLLAGVAMEDVSALLGHSSISTTERYYVPWNSARRDRLVRIVEEVNESDSVLRFLTERMLKKKTGAVPAAPASKPDTASKDE